MAARVLVTGGTGYIGSALVPALQSNGYAVNIFTDDIRDISAVRSALYGCDYLVHLAGVSDHSDAATRQAINHDCFPDIIKASTEAGVKRFLFPSTSALYGTSETECREDAPPLPQTGYAEDKLACEAMLAQYSPPLEYVIVRPGAVCGVAPRMRWDVLVHRMVKDALTKGEITVQGAAHYRPHLHIKDMVNVLLMLLTAQGAHGEIFNVASENLTLLALAEKIQSHIGSHVKINVLPTNDRRSYRISSDKIRQRIGFTPGFHVETAIKELCDALSNNERYNQECV